MRIKRLLMFLTLVCLMVCALTISAFARDPGVSGQIGPDVTYTVSVDGVVTISGTGETYNYSPTYNDFSPFWDSSIRTVIVEMGVTSIGDNLFNNCPNLTSVTLAPGVTYIGKMAFCCCEGLTQLKLPATITRIEKEAFYGCSNLTTINCPKSVTSIAARAFASCDSLKEIPGVEQGGAIRWTLNKDTGVMHFTGSGRMPGFDVVNNRYATWNYLTDYVRSVIIDEGITDIGSFAFWDCQYLESVVIPDTVTAIGKAAFECCYGLKQVQLSEAITKIEGEAFFGCSSLTSITIPESVTQIDEYAFSSTGLTQITVPDPVTYMKGAVFEDCKSLTSVVLGKGLERIPSDTFKGCTSLTQVEIRSDKLSEVGYGSFEGCTALKTLSLPENTEGIDGCAFQDCTSLQSIKLPKELTYISMNAFMNCTALTSMTTFEKVFYISDSAFEGCTGLKEVNLAEGLEQLDSCAFKGCTGLTTIRLPDTVTELGWNGVFEGCTNLETVVLSKNIPQIGENCFRGCERLTHLELPNLLTYIGDFAFYGCTGLKSITIDSPGCSMSMACLPEGITVYGYEGTAVQEYAEIYELTFVSLGSPTIDKYPISIRTSGYDTYCQMELEPPVTIEGLTLGEDYTVSYKNNLNAGTGTVIITGLGSIGGSVEREFTIQPLDFGTSYSSNVIIQLSKGSYPYTGQVIVPELEVYSTRFHCYLEEGVDYTVSSDGKIPDYGWVYVNGIGNYTGQVKQKFTITKAPISNNDFRLEKTQYNYTGEPIKPKVIAPDYLVEGVDYAVEYYDTQIMSGTGTVRICSLGGYWTGSVELYFQVVKGLEAPKVTATNLSPSGKIKLTWGKIDGAQKYQIWRSVVENGTYILVGTAPGTGYVDLQARPGVKYFYKVVAVGDGENGNSDASAPISRAAKLTRPVVQVTRNGANRPVIRWNQVEGAVKYQIYRSTRQNGSYSLLKTVSGTGWVDQTARPGMTYYYKVVAVGRSSEGNSHLSNAVVFCALLKHPLFSLT